MYPAVKNAIVLMFDSLQYNYLHCNGNDWIKTPNFDRFSREGIVFDNCYIEGVPTVPCRRAMLTGRYTLPVNGWSPLTMEETTIADLCWGSNIDSAIIFDCPMYRLPKFGYTRGFDKVWFTHGHEGDQYFYRHDELIHYDSMDFISESSYKAYHQLMGDHATASTVKELDDYLRHRQFWKTDEDQNVAHVMKDAVMYLENRNANKPFFLWVDNFDPHEPWDSPSVYDPDMKCPYNPDYKDKDIFLPFGCEVDGIYTEQELHHVRMLYAEKVTMCDKWLGCFMDHVKRLGLEKDTMIMIVSDHGEPMGNGEHGHGIMRKVRPWPYEELVHGIMMVKAPGIKPKQRSKAFVQSCDVAPTVCDWLGLGVRESHQGKSLLPIAFGQTAKVRNFAIAGYHRYSWSIITDDWSFIHWIKKSSSGKQGQDEMYDFYAELAVAIGKKTQAELNAVQAEMAASASLDGEGQWTCTPTSTSEMPDHDELYDRKTDMAQLHNVISKHPDVAKKLYDQLRTFMIDLKS